MANQAIRQEINLVDSISTSIGTVTYSTIVQLDTAQYSGTPTYWFEAVFSGAASNTGTIKLRDIVAASNVASLAGATSATVIISRVQFTPTAGARTYTVQLVGDGTRSQTVNAARIIILQNEVSIPQTETQIEIGNTTSTLTNTAVADITDPKFWKYTAANWGGTKTFFAEVVWRTSASNTTTITLCRTSDNAANVTIVSALSATSATRTRVSFTPVDGETYKLRALCSTTKSNYTVLCGKIIVRQIGTTADIQDTATTSLIVGGGTALGQGGQALGQSFTAGSSYVLGSISLFLGITGTPTDNLTLEIVTGSISENVIATSNPVDSTTISATPAYIPFTFLAINIISGTKYYLRLTRSGARDTTNACIWRGNGSDVLANGEAYSRDGNSWVTTVLVLDFRFKTIPMLANIESQFLLLNTNDSNATGVQNYLTTWNSSEWNAGSGSITYKHAMDSDNASNSVKLRDVTASTDITNGTVTGSVQQVSSALGVFTNANTLDCWVLDTTGRIASNRILVVYAFLPTVLPELTTEPLVPQLLR